MRKAKFFAAALLAMSSLGAFAQHQFTVQANKPGAEIQPTMYGIFFEDINFGADGGLYAEMVENRSFEFPQRLMGWNTFGNVTLSDVKPAFDRNPHYVTLESAGAREKQTGLENRGFFGMGLKKDMKVLPKVTLAEYLAGRESVPAHVLSPELEQAIVDQPYSDREYHTQEVVKMNKVRIQYGERIILNDLDWTVMNGERWALSGQNGAGKSTLLSLVCADNPQSYACDITLFDNPRGSGESIWDIKKHIGYVSPELHRSYQRDLPAIRIVASGLMDSVGLYVKPKEEDMDKCRFWMKVFGLEGLEDRGFLKLSSGEQRLVLLARAFVKDPELLILDEPLHGLDNRNRRLVKDVIEAFCRRQNKTMIMVTHYKEELPACIDHSIFLMRHTND